MDKRKEHKRLLDLKYPTRQDMRECMWLGKEIIEQLEQQLVNSDPEKPAHNNKYTAPQATPKSCKTCLHNEDRIRECDICLPDYTFYEQA